MSHHYRRDLCQESEPVADPPGCGLGCHCYGYTLSIYVRYDTGANCNSLVVRGTLRVFLGTMCMDLSG